MKGARIKETRVGTEQDASSFQAPVTSYSTPVKVQSILGPCSVPVKPIQVDVWPPHKHKLAPDVDGQRSNEL